MIFCPQFLTFTSLKKCSPGVGLLGQQVLALAALAEVFGLVPSTHIAVHNS